MKHDGLYHIHKRKRLKNKLDPYPHPVEWKRKLDASMTFVGAIAPLTLIPQVIEIFASKDASGVSVMTWGLLTFFALLWLIYGIVHNEKPLIINYTLFLFFDGLILVLSLIY